MTTPFVKLKLTPEQHNRVITLCGAQSDLVEALKDFIGFEPATPEQIEAAREHCGDDELNIDDDAGTSTGCDEGYWIQAWVWMENPT